MKRIFLLIATISANYCSNGQNVGIGTATPDSSAIVEIKSTDKGFMLPRLADTNTITNPKKGLVIYNNTDSNIWYYTGSHWQIVGATNTPQNDSLWYLNADSSAIQTQSNLVDINANNFLTSNVGANINGNLIV